MNRATPIKRASKATNATGNPGPARSAKPGAAPVNTNSGGYDFPLLEWWDEHVLTNVDHDSVVESVREDSGWSSHFAFMTLMSAGIAILGLLLSSPAVVIGAMLISPLMGPIIGVGFALATFDSYEIRRNLRAILVGTLMATAFCALIVIFSPLQQVTPEIASRTRPNLFDLLVALLSGLAATYAMVRGRHGAIVGVAIATALMPPIAVMGFGLATANWPVLSGSFLLFFTNLMTIAASAAVLARIYGFAANLSPRQTRLQATLLILSLVLLAVPLGFSLKQIAWEAFATREAKSIIADAFGPNSHLGEVDIAFDRKPILISATVLTPNYRTGAESDIEARLTRGIGSPVDLSIDQVRTVDGTGAGDTAGAAAAAAARADRIARALASVAGVEPNQVLVDRSRKIAQVRARALPDASLATYFAIERRLGVDEAGWTIELVPPLLALPQPSGNSAASAQAFAIAGWAGARTGIAIRIRGDKEAAAEAAAAIAKAGGSAEVEPGGGALRMEWITDQAVG